MRLNEREEPEPAVVGPTIYIDADAFATPAEWAALCRLIARIADEVEPCLLG